ncbi:SH3 domain-containing protein [Actinomadura sp. NAK00032]|uniref:SH3 domain-containing protein n=1 Tax=Actinomadura sp. NAK00032 TaxID=2742128 RepID=UPI00158FFE9D|nr:SH3 domain-containing protein [Actinomadura sp. NAK00032]QKW34828.1 SH3 domain-containing protein [Actinomadura sp. NAK00032]
MRVGTKLGAGLVAGVLAAGTLSVATAAEAEPPPQPGQQEEEGHGPGAIVVGPEGAAKAMNRLLARDEERVRWCTGTVLPANGLNVRTGPGVGYTKVGALEHGTRVRTDWDTIQRRDGYLWVRMSRQRWIADYKLGNGNGKWYVRYSDC